VYWDAVADNKIELFALYMDNKVLTDPLLSKAEKFAHVEKDIAIWSGNAILPKVTAPGYVLLGK
jgi:hypothetical protein